MTDRERELNALIAVHFIGWRWFASTGRHINPNNVLVLFPPEREGFEAPEFRADWYEVTDRKGAHSGWYAASAFKDGAAYGLPDYMNSLDACATFEAVIKERSLYDPHKHTLLDTYTETLVDLLGHAPHDSGNFFEDNFLSNEAVYEVATAPSALRVEAALRSAGLWPEEAKP